MDSINAREIQLGEWKDFVQRAASGALSRVNGIQKGAAAAY